MSKYFENLDELKRTMYLWAIPLIVFSLLLNNLLDESEGTSLYIHIILIIYFTISEFMLLKRYFFRFIELSNLLLISVYHVNIFHESIQYILFEGAINLGDFIIWMPLFVIYIYLALGRKKGLLFSLGIFVITLGIGFTHFEVYRTSTLDSLTQYYMANVVYILAFYYSQYAFGTFSELKTIKSSAYIDPLTNIPNRRKLSITFDELWKGTQSGHHNLSVIMVDIDNFKLVNDQFGHDTGDLVLQEFSTLIKNLVSDYEVFGRWGGEEFVILVPSSLRHAVKLAELIKSNVEQHNFTTVTRITSSFGVASYQPGDSKEKLFKRADIALYQSKTNGKNRATGLEAS
jgi:diguanylate cyclase (GGDEF)-like protein